MSAFRALCDGGMLIIKGNMPAGFQANLRAAMRSFREEVLKHAEKAKLGISALKVLGATDVVVLVDIYSCHIVLANGFGSGCIDFAEKNQAIDSKKLWQQVGLKVGKPLWMIAIPKYMMDGSYKQYTTDEAQTYVRTVLSEVDHENLFAENKQMPTGKDPVELSVALDSFRKDHPDGQKTAFIVMSFHDSPAHIAITEAIKSVPAEHNIRALRADDKEYTDDLFSNVRTYMHGCVFGIAVFERLMGDVFNPNVSLEVGYLMSMGKQVLLLKDNTLKNLQTDLVGRLYKSFNPQAIKDSLPRQIEKWLLDKGWITHSKISSRGH